MRLYLNKSHRHTHRIRRQERYLNHIWKRITHRFPLENLRISVHAIVSFLASALLLSQLVRLRVERAGVKLRVAGYLLSVCFVWTWCDSTVTDDWLPNSARLWSCIW